MTIISFKVGETPCKPEALGNLIYVHPNDFSKLFESIQQENYYLSILGYIFTIKEHIKVKDATLAFNKIQRTHLQLATNDIIQVSPFYLDDMFPIITIITIELSLLSKRINIDFETEKLTNTILNLLNNQIFTMTQRIILNIGENIIITINDIECMNPETLQLEKSHQGLLINKTKIIFITSPGITIKGDQSLSSTMLIKSDWNFSQLGVGGLDTEFSEIFRRAFISRILPSTIVSKLGIKHIKGILLHGPPGTGKTLMARKIGEMLNAKSLKIVNGPEILNQYVGKSEENIRNLFQEAEIDMKKNGENSNLYIIIFDEIDAICKSRGSTNGGTGVSDSIVNQLLSKIDGVNSLNNILIIGMTNRKDMIDEALLRPGRLEVHIEISLPDTKGRMQILTIHTAKMKENNFLDCKVNIDDLANRTKNWTGAELEGLVKNASSYAFSRQLDITQLTKITNPDNIKITNDDFIQAIHSITPAFGITNEFDGKIPNGIINYGERFQSILDTCYSFAKQVQNSDKTPLVSYILEGPIGCGKTTLATTLAIKSNFPFIKLINIESMIGLNESSKCQRITKVFQDTYKSPLSVIVLDDIERLVEYVPIDQRFSNALLQTLLGCIKHTQNKRKLLIIGTTSNITILKEMQVLSAFNAIIQIPKIQPGNDMSVVLNSLNTFSDDQLTYVIKNINKSLPIRTLIMINEMAKQDISGDALIDRFLEFITDVDESGVVLR